MGNPINKETNQDIRKMFNQALIAAAAVASVSALNVT